MTQQGRRLPEPMPPTYCVAGEGARPSHDWVPLRDDEFYCSRCLARLEGACVDEWRQSRQAVTRLFDPPSVVSVDTGLLAAEALSLTRLERRLLLRMASDPDAVVGYSDLADCVWGRPAADEHDRAALRQHVATLRRKLTMLRVEINTVASVGYRFKFGCVGDAAEDA